MYLPSFYDGFKKIAGDATITPSDFLRNLISINKKENNATIQGFYKYNTHKPPPPPLGQKNTLSIGMHGEIINGKKIYSPDKSLLDEYPGIDTNKLKYTADDIASVLGQLTNTFHNVRDASCNIGGKPNILDNYKHLAPNATNIIFNPVENSTSQLPKSYTLETHGRYIGNNPGIVLNLIPPNKRQTNNPTSTYYQFIRTSRNQPFKNMGKTSF